MLKKHSQLFEALFTASDLLVVSIAWVLSYYVRFSLDLFPVGKGIPPFGDYLKMLIFVWMVWAFVFRRMGLYRPMRGASVLRESFTVIKANSLSVLLFLAVVYLFREKSAPFSRLVFVIFWVFSTVATVGSRNLVRAALRNLRRHGYNLRYSLVVGGGSLAHELAARIHQHPEYGIEVMGCLVEESDIGRVGTLTDGNGFPTQIGLFDSQDRPELRHCVPMRIIGTYPDLPKLLRSGNIDQVLVALPLKDHERLETVIASIGDSMVDVRVVPDVHRFIQLGCLIEEFDGLPVVSLASTPLSGFARVLKRGLDLLFGAVFLVVALPVMAFTALLIKLTSRGPVLYVQERVGLDGQVFPIYKFRTMELDAEVDGAKFAVQGDPRVTTLGRILRRLNIDELPQLVNVIMGHMSLVGPRPERPVFIEEFRRHIPRYMLRHKVQAGMTGWAQVHGWRGNTSIQKRIEHDLYYIENWSLLLDLKILGLTFVNSFRDRNAIDVAFAVKTPRSVASPHQAVFWQPPLLLTSVLSERVFEQRYCERSGRGLGREEMKFFEGQNLSEGYV